MSTYPVPEPGAWYPREKRHAPSVEESMALVVYQTQAIAARVDAIHDRLDAHEQRCAALLGMEPDLKAIAEWRQHRIAGMTVIKWAAGAVLSLYAIVEGTRHFFGTWTGKP